MSKRLAELLGFEYSKYNNIILPIEEKSSTDLQPRSDVANNVVETLFELPYGQVELIPFNSYSYTVSNVSDLQRDFYSLYFYCDIVAPTVVGDVKVPLMRCVNISGNHEKTVDRIYETAHYVQKLEWRKRIKKVWIKSPSRVRIRPVPENQANAIFRRASRKEKRRKSATYLRLRDGHDR